MWADGDSAAQIAGTLGGVTRNAVLGKIHRLGLADTAPDKKPHGRGGPRLSREEMARRQAARALVRKIAATPHIDAPPKPPPPTHEFLNLTFDQLSYGDCRFPIGDAPPYLYCGNPTVDGTSWCRQCFEFTHKRGG
jgi:GcrA cell cycle regulator